MPYHKYKNGFSLVEVVITTSIFLLVILGLVGGFTAAVKASLENMNKVKAAFLAEEGLEAVRLMRDASWSGNIASQALGTPFYIYFNGTTWSSTTTSALIDGVFQRSITLSGVYRDSSQNIVASGGTLDPQIKKVTASVSWSSGSATTTRSISTYLTNVFEN